MFIQTETTPNPATLKFLPGRDVLGDQPRDFAAADAAAASPLAARLFEVENVTGVYLGADFITVTKADGEWQHMKPALLGAIMEHFTSGAPILSESAAAATPQAAPAAPANEEDGEIIAAIQELLETRVRPAVAQDGGDIVFDRYDQGIVYVHMQGACAGCPASTMTLKNGVENMLRHFIPEVTEVRPI